MSDPRPNLLRDGYERTASLILWRMRDRTDSAMCFVRPSGAWLLRSTAPSAELPESTAFWVGTYNRNTPINSIEDDLIERIREIQTRKKPDPVSYSGHDDR
jgi:hypothetical protein